MPKFTSLAVAAIAVTSLIFEAPFAAARVGERTTDGTEILIENFEDPIHSWKELDDPVMGGKSTGTFSVVKDDGVAKFVGEVVDVPFLHAPGFIQARTAGFKTFPDVSSCDSLKLVLKTNEEYDGYRISFGNKKAKHGKMFAFGFKADLKDIPSDDFGELVIPFSGFTDYWDDATGEAIVKCEDDEQYCPDEETLQNMQVMAVWGEGVAGKVSLEIKSISAIGCNE